MTATADEMWQLLGELMEAQKETERKFQETERILRKQSQETDRRFKETERFLKEQSRRVDEQLGKLGNCPNACSKSAIDRLAP